MPLNAPALRELHDATADYLANIGTGDPADQLRADEQLSRLADWITSPGTSPAARLQGLAKIITSAWSEGHQEARNEE